MPPCCCRPKVDPGRNATAGENPGDPPKRCMHSGYQGSTKRPQPLGGSQRLTPDIRTRTGSSRPAGRRLQRPLVSAPIKTPQGDNPSVKGQMAEVHAVHPGTRRWRESPSNAVTSPAWDSRGDAAEGVRPKPRATPRSPELAAHPPAPLNPRKQTNFSLQADGEDSSHNQWT